MVIISPATRYAILLLLSCALSFVGCSPRSTEQLYGVWRSDDAVASKKLVLEFAPGGQGKVFSGSLIGFPTDASFEWQKKGDQITIETKGEDSVTQTLTVLSQGEDALSVEVNRTSLDLVRIDGVIDDEAAQILSSPKEEL